MKVTIQRYRHQKIEDVVYDYQPHFDRERPMALDVLLQAQENAMPDLAYRYGCRNGLCGVCTADINGKDRLACRTKVKAGSRIGPAKALPAIKDLIVRRDAVNRQLVGRLPDIKPREEARAQSSEALQSLNRCIECYACLDGCSSHAKNAQDGPYIHGNPYSFLRIQKIRVDPNASDSQRAQAVRLARELGIDQYDAKKVPGCGVGIDLRKEVILPLQAASTQQRDSEQQDCGNTP